MDSSSSRASDELSLTDTELSSALLTYDGISQ